MGTIFQSSTSCIADIPLGTILPMGQTECGCNYRVFFENTKNSTLTPFRMLLFAPKVVELDYFSHSVKS